MGRDVEEFLRHEQRDEGHDLKVGFERFEVLPDFRIFVGIRLMHRKLGRKRRFLQRIGLGAGLLRRDIDGDDFVAALEQRFEHRLAERLLSVNDDTHVNTPLSHLPGRSTLCRPLAAGMHRAQETRYAASALAGFSGAVIAPDVLISANSFSE